MNNEDLQYMNSCVKDHYTNLAETDKRRDYIKALLQTDILKVVFTKVNGDAREMYCTLQNEFVPEHKKYFTKTGEARQKNMDVLSVFDMEKGDWRSFRIDALTDLEIVWEESLDFEFSKTEEDFSDVPF